MPKLQVAPLLSFRFLRAYVVHMRPYLLFMSGIGGLAGIAFGPNQHSLSFLLAFLPCFLGYGFGQALTDIFQTDTDAISAPYRPLVHGEVSKKDVLIVSVLGLLFCGGLLSYLNIYNLFFAFLTISGLATYTYFKKNFWFAGPFYNSWIVTLLPVMGFLSCGGSITEIFQTKMIWLYIFTFFSYGNFVLIGYLKDITADRATGYKTFPVVWGWDATVSVGDFFVFLSILGVYQIISFTNMFSIFFFVAGSLIAIAGQFHAHYMKKKTEENSTFAIAATVRSFIFWHIAVFLEMRPGMLLFAIVFYALFELVLYFRPKQSQI